MAWWWTSRGSSCAVHDRCCCRTGDEAWRTVIIVVVVIVIVIIIIIIITVVAASSHALIGIALLASSQHPLQQLCRVVKVVTFTSPSRRVHTRGGGRGGGDGGLCADSARWLRRWRVEEEAPTEGSPSQGRVGAR